jgi:hypothetical protein
MSSSILVATSIPLLVGNDLVVCSIGGADQPLSRIEGDPSLLTSPPLPLRTTLLAIPLLRLLHSAQNREPLGSCQSLRYWRSSSPCGHVPARGIVLANLWSKGSVTMAERTAGSVDGALQQDAAERLLEWGFSHEEIAGNLRQSETWVRAVQERQRIDDSDRSTRSRIRTRMITPKNEE